MSGSFLVLKENISNSLSIQENIITLKSVIWIMPQYHSHGKCVCDGKEITVVQKLQLYSICVWWEHCVYVCTHWKFDFQLPGNGHSFPLMYPVKKIWVAHSLPVESNLCPFASSEKCCSKLCLLNAVLWQIRCLMSTAVMWSNWSPLCVIRLLTV